jgi:hypothetical protein
MAEGSKGRVIVLGAIGREPFQDTAAVATALRFALAFLVIGELGTGRSALWSRPALPNQTVEPGRSVQDVEIILRILGVALVSES